MDRDVTVNVEDDKIESILMENEYINYYSGDDVIQLDGQFSIVELEKIISFMKQSIKENQ